MRVLLCSDIHGNAEALGAVLKEPADYVLCAGDLVHFGPQPKTCISLIRKRAAVVVRGNHDHGAGFGENCHFIQASTGWFFSATVYSPRPGNVILGRLPEKRPVR